MPDQTRADCVAFAITADRQEAHYTFADTRKNCCLKLDYHPQFSCDGGEYVFLPGCCYDGNRFQVLKKHYPPLFTADEAAIEMPVVITDIPRLNEDGSGAIEVTTGDVSVPCVGIFSAKHKRAVLLFTIQQLENINLGLAYTKGTISITYPKMRSRIYKWPFMTDNGDDGMTFAKDTHIRIPYQILEFLCEDLMAFYQMFYENRKIMGLDDTRPMPIPYKEQVALQLQKFNTKNWRPAGGFYGVGTEDAPIFTWQPGWVGGGMSSYALMRLGGPSEQARALSTLKHLFHTQAKSGFFYESTDQYGNIHGMGFGEPATKNWCLIRKTADALYFIWKHFALLEHRGCAIDPLFLQGSRKAADALVRLWDTYGQLGQFADLESGDLVVGGSTSAAIAPAALVGAYRYFHDQCYLQTAQKAAESYYQEHLLKGYTTGGPSEILQCPDSESAFALLESFVELYKATQNEKWMKYAIDALHFASSWVTAYNYQFPEYSEFYRRGIKSVGSVFANAQNKHAAPGICTLSGNSILAVYRYTGKDTYLALLKDICLTISQYLSTSGNPIYSLPLKKDSALSELAEQTVSTPLPEGYICERVNLSDWEGKECIGGVFNGSCWCETSNLLVLAELKELFEQ